MVIFKDDEKKMADYTKATQLNPDLAETKRKEAADAERAEQRRREVADQAKLDAMGIKFTGGKTRKSSTSSGRRNKDPEGSVGYQGMTPAAETAIHRFRNYKPLVAEYPVGKPLAKYMIDKKSGLEVIDPMWDQILGDYTTKAGNILTGEKRQVFPAEIPNYALDADGIRIRDKDGNFVVKEGGKGYTKTKGNPKFKNSEIEGEINQTTGKVNKLGKEGDYTA